MTTMDLFGPKPRRPPQKLMHVADVYCDMCSEEVQVVKFVCSRCDYATDWVEISTVTEAKRGIPCPVCTAKNVNNEETQCQIDTI